MAVSKGNKSSGTATSGTAKKLTAKEQAAQHAQMRKTFEAKLAAQAAEILALKAKQKAADTAAQDEEDTLRVKRPKGSAGNGYSLQTEMKLDDNKLLYKRIQRTVRRCVDKAGLDESKGIRGQDTQKLSNIYKAARELQPRLKRFINDWATAEMVKMLLRNRRQYASRRAREESPELEDDEMELDLDAMNLDD